VVLAVGFADFEIFVETFSGRGSSKRLAINDTSTATVERAFIGFGNFAYRVPAIMRSSTASPRNSRRWLSPPTRSQLE
jgi:hypothetical protein